MKCPRIFTANFEQSVELLYEKKKFETLANERVSKKVNTRKVTPRKRAIFIIILCSLMQGSEWLTNYGYEHPEGMTINAPTMNFLPAGTALTGMIICLLLRVVYNFVIEFDNIKEKKRDTITFMWVTYGILVMWLGFLTNLSGAYYFQFIGYVIVGWVLFSIVIFVSKKRAIEKILFGETNKRNTIDKVANSLFKFFSIYGLALLGIYQVFKSIFREQLESAFDIGPELTTFSGIIVFLIIETLMLVYIFFPTIIQIFYHVKYSEELRELEGKSQLEWYGEKYFLKHIKGTEREK